MRLLNIVCHTKRR